MKTHNLSEWETGAFKPVHILMLRGRHYWLCIFINHAIPDIQRKLQELKARPQTPLSTLVEGAFKVYNSQDLTEEANKDKRLIKNKNKKPDLEKQKTDLDCSDSRTTSRGPCRAKMAGSLLGLNQCAFVRKGDTGQKNVLSALLWDA